MRTHAHRVMGAAIAAALLVAACGDDSGSDGEPAEATESTGGETSDGEEAEGGETTEGDGTAAGGGDTTEGDGAAEGDLDPAATFRMSYSVGPSRWDAHRASSSFDNTSLFLTYDRLVHLTPEAEPIPGLATEWEFADDESYLEMTLREGVTFHDGEPFNAQAVKANIERGKEAENSAVAGELAVVDEVEVVDPQTVRFHVNGPAASLPLILSDRSGVMISPAAFENPNLDEQPVGAGMFEVVDYEPGGHITYEAYEDYWDQDAVNVARVEYLIQADSITRLNAFRDGQVDWTFVDPAEAEQAESAGANISPSSTLSFFHIQLNRSFEPFADLQVRQALNYAIDREAIVEGLLRGYGSPAVQPFPEGYFAYNEEIGTDFYTYDPDRARELLEEAGYADGFEFDLYIPTISYYTDVAAALQGQLAEVGIEANITSIPGEQFADIFYVQLEGDAGFVPWGGRHDPSLTLALLYSDEGFSNPGRHTTDAVTEAYESTLAIQPEDERAAAAQAASAAVTEDALDVVLYYQDTPVITNDRVTGYEAYMSGKPEFRGVGMLAE